MELTRTDTTVTMPTVQAQASHTGTERAAPESAVQTPSQAVQTAQSQVQAAAPDMSAAELDKLMEEPIKKANQVLAGSSRMIEREVHEVTKTLMFKIKDTKTNEVIAEYPPKKIQDMIAKMWELAGLFIDQKA